MIPDEVQRISPDAVRRPSRKAALMLPDPLAWSRRGVLATSLSCIVALSAVLSSPGSTDTNGWIGGGFFVLAGVVGMFGLARRLPLQNVGAAFLVLWASAFVGVTLGVKSEVLFGPLEYNPHFGPKLLGVVPWQLPFLFAALAIASRETARLILRPWRREKHYGFWLLGTAALLMCVTDVALQPFALHVVRWWTWTTPGLPGVSKVVVDGVPWMVYLSTLILAVGMLLFVGPWLIAKRPLPTPPDYHPLALWLSLTVFFLVGDLVRGLWVSTSLSVSGALVVGLLAWRARSALVGSPSAEGVSLA